MSYFIFKLGKKQFALDLEEENFIVEPTQINKINKPEDIFEEECVGQINYKNEIIEIYDIARQLVGETLKKFDGLLFIETPHKRFAIKFNGFYKIEDSPLKSKMITIDEIIEATSLEGCFDD